jgi:hypothetical protein
MVYCIDTSALVFLDRQYAYEVFPSLWEDLLVGLVQQGRLIASDEVKEELKRGDDELYKWLMTHCRQMFIPSDTIIMNRMVQILSEFTNWINPEKPSKNQADPFVVALALEAQNVCPSAAQHEIMVVTYENFTGNLAGPKMPDICRYYGLRVGKLIDVFRAERWRIG